MTITVTAADVNAAIRELGGDQIRPAIAVRPVADGWVLTVNLIHFPSRRVDYGRSGISYESQKMCHTLGEVLTWISLGLERFKCKTDAFDAGWRLDLHSSKDEDEQIADFWIKMSGLGVEAAKDEDLQLTDKSVQDLLEIRMTGAPTDPPVCVIPVLHETLEKAVVEGRLTAGTEKGKSILQRLVAPLPDPMQGVKGGT